MRKHCLLVLMLLTLPIPAVLAQTGVITGSVKDCNTQQPLVGAALLLEGTTLGTATDPEGRFRLEKIPVGSYNLRASLVGYAPQTKLNVNVTPGNAQMLTFELSQDVSTLQEVVVSSGNRQSAAVADLVTPLSVQGLSTEEIRSNPGGNFDISKVVQVLPEVASNGTGAGPATT